jgi:hypothetical protein
MLERPKHMESITEVQLCELALKFVEGRVYHTGNVPRDMLEVVFMPLAFMPRRQLRGKHLVYAVLGEDQQCGRMVNNYPIFTACHLLNRRDAARLVLAIKEAHTARQAFFKKEKKQ